MHVAVLDFAIYTFRMTLLDDLRFVIGLFFLLVAATLMVAGSGPAPAPDLGPGNLNLFAVGTMGGFAVLMIGSAFLFPMKIAKARDQ